MQCPDVIDEEYASTKLSQFALTPIEFAILLEVRHIKATAQQLIWYTCRPTGKGHILSYRHDGIPRDAVTQSLTALLAKGILQTVSEDFLKELDYCVATHQPFTLIRSADLYPSVGAIEFTFGGAGLFELAKGTFSGTGSPDTAYNLFMEDRWGPLEDTKDFDGEIFVAARKETLVKEMADFVDDGVRVEIERRPLLWRSHWWQMPQPMWLAYVFTRL